MTFVTVKPAVRRRPVMNIDRWLDELMQPVAGVRSSNQVNGATPPPVNVIEDNNGFHIQIAAPGLDKGDFEIKVEKDVLTINGKREATVRDGEKYHRREFGNYLINRHFQLPDTVDATAIQAKYVNGILEVVVPKKAKEPVRKIEIA